jgi:hypothetical protein
VEQVDNFVEEKKKEKNLLKKEEEEEEGKKKVENVGAGCCSRPRPSPRPKKHRHVSTLQVDLHFVFLSFFLKKKKCIYPPLKPMSVR